MSPQDLALRKAQVLALSIKLSIAADGASHAVLIESLLTLCIAVAEHHGCCTSAASGAMLAAHQRLELAAQGRPAGAPVH
ncbi:MAG: hypothetical protein Q8J78_08010 [Moraxellaceae bacterium]|nr:hypothetical protein [Moraxellaceae bacterium]